MLSLILVAAVLSSPARADITSGVSEEALMDQAAEMSLDSNSRLDSAEASDSSESAEASIPKALAVDDRLLETVEASAPLGTPSAIPVERAVLAADASSHVYLIYELFRCGYLRTSSSERTHVQTYGKFDSSTQLCDRHVPITRTHGDGSVVVFPLNDLPKEWAGLLNLAPKYKPAFVFCSAVSRADCGSFSVLYLDNSRECFASKGKGGGCQDPVLAFKGTSSLLDWKNDIRSRGARGTMNLMRDVFETLEPSNRVRARSEVEGSPGNWLYRATSGYFSEGAARKNLIVTGHSLGGAMAQNYVALVDRLNGNSGMTFDLLTYNSLGKSGMSASLMKYFKVPATALSQLKELFSDDLDSPYFKLSDAVRAVNYYTKGDPLDYYNRLTGLKNIGPSVRIPSIRRLNPDGLLYKANGVENWIRQIATAHTIKTVCPEIREAKKNLLMLRALYTRLLSQKPAKKRFERRSEFALGAGGITRSAPADYTLSSTHSWQYSARWIHETLIQAPHPELFP